jgi:hypothetical protein
MRNWILITIIVSTVLSASSAHGQFEIFEKLRESVATAPSAGGAAFPIELVWQTYTFTPPGYEGKPLPTNASAITVVALTPTRSVAGLEFIWELEDSSSSVQGPEQRSVGGNTFTFLADPLVRGFVHVVGVTARSVSTGETSTAQVRIPLVTPEAPVYLLREDGGVLGEALESISVPPGTQASLLALPFNFNIDSAEDLSFLWVFDSLRAVGDPVLDLSISSASGAIRNRELNLEVEHVRPQIGAGRTQTTVGVSITP